MVFNCCMLGTWHLACWSWSSELKSGKRHCVFYEGCNLRNKLCLQYWSSQLVVVHVRYDNTGHAIMTTPLVDDSSCQDWWGQRYDAIAMVGRTPGTNTDDQNALMVGGCWTSSSKWFESSCCKKKGWWMMGANCSRPLVGTVPPPWVESSQAGDIWTVIEERIVIELLFLKGVRGGVLDGHWNML